LQFHIKKVLAILVRTDTAEIVEERPMTDEEKQMQIEFADEPEIEKTETNNGLEELYLDGPGRPVNCLY
jgi:hypothetical protein